MHLAFQGVTTSPFLRSSKQGSRFVHQDQRTSYWFQCAHRMEPTSRPRLEREPNRALAVWSLRGNPSDVSTHNLQLLKPWKINMFGNPKIEVWKMMTPLKSGDSLGSMLIFRGVYQEMKTRWRNLHSHHVHILNYYTYMFSKTTHHVLFAFKDCLILYPPWD